MKTTKTPATKVATESTDKLISSAELVASADAALSSHRRAVRKISAVQRSVTHLSALSDAGLATKRQLAVLDTRMKELQALIA